MFPGNAPFGAQPMRNDRPDAKQQRMSSKANGIFVLARGLAKRQDTDIVENIPTFCLGFTMIDVLNTGLVYRNPQPQRRSIHAWHPTLVVLSESEWLAAFDLAEAVESLDYRTYCSRSSDGGVSWNPPQRIFPDENDSLQRHSVRLSRISDGTVVAMGARRYLESEDEDTFSRETFGVKPAELILLRSQDKGQTWEGPTVVQPPLAGPFETCHAVVELSDGRWLLPTSVLRAWDGSAPDGIKAIALVSHDQGKTWTEYLNVLDRHAQGIFHFESSLIELPDKRLLSVSWAFDDASGTSRPLPYTLSDDGTQFSPPRETGINGETSKLLSLGDNRVLCVYRRFDKPGLWANVVQIDQDEWVNLAEAPLWQGTGSKMRGEGTSADELSALEFGFPQPHLLPDGTLTVLFWCREDCIHNIRWVRFAIDG